VDLVVEDLETVQLLEEVEIHGHQMQRLFLDQLQDKEIMAEMDMLDLGVDPAVVAVLEVLAVLVWVEVHRLKLAAPVEMVPPMFMLMVHQIQ
jgi:hypothetical protein